MEEWLKKYNLRNYDSDVCEKISNVRRPLVLIRGKPITSDQVKQLIIREEPLFGDCPESGKCWPDPRRGRGVLKNVFYRRGYDWLSTWAYSDGTIGGNLIHLGKYPKLNEFIPMYGDLSERYPFLDMVVSYTFFNESCCWLCNQKEPEAEWKEMIEEYPEIAKEGRGFCSCRDCEPYLEKIYYYKENFRYPECDFKEFYYRNWEFEHVRSDVGDFIGITIWIHDGRTEVLFGEEAGLKFNQYDDLYCAPEYAFMFGSSLYRYGKTCIYDKKFVEDCFAYMGKPKSLCDEYVKQGFLSPFQEKEIVVTKDWAIDKYKRFLSAGDGGEQPF